MAKDYIQKYINYFSVQTGGAPARDRLEWAIRETLTEKDLQLFFILPYSGAIPADRLKKKALRAGYTEEEFQQHLDYMHQEGYIISYTGDKGRVYERAFVSFTVEQQVRRRRGTPVGAAYGEFWDALATLTNQMPSKTPYFRVTPVETSLTGEDKKRNIKIDVDIPDPREVLPIDVITALVENEPLIAVSDCYCRIAKENRGDGTCHHIKETCFTFNELAQTLIETGLARQLTPAEAAEILLKAEEDGLVHNVDNCQGELKALCNCCSCCCPAIASYRNGVRNVNAPSRYLAVLDPANCTNCGDCVAICPVDAISPGDSLPIFENEKCIGCGLCVTNCPENTIRMELRQRLPKIPASNDQLWGTIRREAVISMVKEKIFGKQGA